MSGLDEASSEALAIAKLLGLGDGASSSRTRQRRRALLAGGAALVIAIAFFALSPGDDGLRYTTAPALRGDITVKVTATGTLQPTVQVDVGSELSGTIRSVDVDFNDKVGVGQVLARLDTTRLDAQVLQSKAVVESAEAKLVQAQATVAEAESQLARLLHVREISGGKVPSQQELDTANAVALRARSEVASSRAAIAQAKATLDAQETDLGKAAIRSPVDGIVLLRAAEPGQTVAASLQAPILFTLAQDLTRMELHVSVDEADVGQVKEGQEATFSVDAWPDRSFSARVAQVRFGATATEGVGVVTYETVLEVDNAEHLLRPGMTATAEITVNRIDDALLVPNAALRFTPPVTASTPSGGLLRALVPGRRGPQRRARSERNGQAREERVYVLDGGETEPIELAIGATDGSFSEVTRGELEPGTELVVDAVVPKS
ncbi:MAG: efflux RND transporter periplasmic adaptor subunit [Myxococcota bacterium]